MSDVVDEALMVSVRNIEASGVVESEKVAQTFLRDYLILNGYPDTLSEVDIKVEFGLFGKEAKHLRADLMVRRWLLVELKHADDIKERDKLQLQKYMGRTGCKHALLIVFPKTLNGQFRAEWSREEVNEITSQVHLAWKGKFAARNSAAHNALDVLHRQGL